MQWAQKQRPLMKKEATIKHKGLKNKDIRLKKRQPQNVRGSKIKISNEKKATQNARGSKIKTSNEKSGNPKMRGARTSNLTKAIPQTKN
jgi:hypothetical protein